MYIYIYIYIYIPMYIYIHICIFPAQNARLKKSSHKTSDAERMRTRLLYLTQSGGH